MLPLEGIHFEIVFQIKEMIKRQCLLDKKGKACGQAINAWNLSNFCSHMRSVHEYEIYVEDPK